MRRSAGEEDDDGGGRARAAIDECLGQRHEPLAELARHDALLRRRQRPPRMKA